MGKDNLKKTSTKQPSLIFPQRKNSSLSNETRAFKYTANKQDFLSIEETPLPFFETNQSKGSMTVEAALTVPLFLFFFMNILSVIEIYNLHSTLYAALHETGREICVYGYAYDRIMDEEDDTGLEALVEDIVFSYLYVKTRVEKLAGADYLENSPLVGGKDGLVYVDSSIMHRGDIVDLVASYSVSPLVSIVGFRPALFFSRFYGRAWTGYELAGTGDKAESKEYVYVAEYAAVYHTSKSCTYISLSVRECDAALLHTLHSETGGSYSPCEVCRPTDEKRLYITTSGERYHRTLDCSGLRRTIRLIPLAEAKERYRSCSRCEK